MHYVPATWFTVFTNPPRTLHPVPLPFFFKGVKLLCESICSSAHTQLRSPLFRRVPVYLYFGLYSIDLHRKFLFRFNVWGLDTSMFTFNIVLVVNNCEQLVLILSKFLFCSKFYSWLFSRKYSLITNRKIYWILVLEQDFFYNKWLSGN